MTQRQRQRLPNRRASCTFSFESQGLQFTATFSCDAGGEVREIFLTNHRAQSQAGINAADSAIVCSHSAATFRAVRHDQKSLVAGLAGTRLRPSSNSDGHHRQRATKKGDRIKRLRAENIPARRKSLHVRKRTAMMQTDLARRLKCPAIASPPKGRTTTGEGVLGEIPEGTGGEQAVNTPTAARRTVTGRLCWPQDDART